MSPVLETPSYISKTGHRWPAAQQADAEQRATRDPHAFASRAQGEFPIFTWPLWTFATLSAAVVVALACLAWYFARHADRSSPSFA